MGKTYVQCSISIELLRADEDDDESQIEMYKKQQINSLTVLMIVVIRVKNSLIDTINNTSWCFGVSDKLRFEDLFETKLFSNWCFMISTPGNASEIASPLFVLDTVIKVIVLTLGHISRL